MLPQQQKTYTFRAFKCDVFTIHRKRLLLYNFYAILHLFILAEILLHASILKTTSSKKYVLP